MAANPQHLSPAEQELVALVDPDGIARDLAAMVGHAPVGGSAGEAAVQAWAAARLRALGVVVDEWEVDLDRERAAPDFPGMEVERDRLVGVVGTWGGAGRPGLALCGHTDVVPPGDPGRWTTAPFELVVADGVARGRGVCDMLGGVAAILGAVAALTAARATLARPLTVHLVSGEEDGGAGAFATLRRGHTAEACLIAEPTGGSVVPANAGSLTFRLEVAGRAAHGSVRTRGENVLDHLPVVLQALRDLEGERNAVLPQLFSHLDLVAPISVGVARAGDWASTVPDLLVLEGRYGVLPGEETAAARTAFEAAVGAVGGSDPWLRDHPVRVSWPGGVFASGALPDGHPFLVQAVTAVRDVGIAAAPVHGAPYGSDLRHYTAHGIPTVQFGPGDLDQAHAANEQVGLAEVVRCAQAYAVLALRMCGA